MKICSKDYCVKKSEEIKELINIIFSDEYTQQSEKWTNSQIIDGICDKIKKNISRLILVEKDKIIGLGLLTKEKTFSYPHQYLFKNLNYDKQYFYNIEKIGISENYRNNKIGSQLLIKLKKIRDKKYMLLVHCKQNRISFYEKNDFELLGKLKINKQPNIYALVLKGSY